MIDGKALVVFGGKIGFMHATAEIKEKKYLLVGLRELNEIHEIGTYDECLPGKDPDVYLCFDNPKSIDIVVEVLEMAKKYLEDGILEVAEC